MSWTSLNEDAIERFDEAIAALRSTVADERTPPITLRDELDAKLKELVTAVAQARQICKVLERYRHACDGTSEILLTQERRIDSLNDQLASARDLVTGYAARADALQAASTAQAQRIQSLERQCTLVETEKQALMREIDMLRHATEIQGKRSLMPAMQNCQPDPRLRRGK